MSSSSLEDLSEPRKMPQRTAQGMIKVGPDEMTPGRLKLRSWLGKYFRVVITDGRILVGVLSCTDKDANIVLSGCVEYITEDGEPRILGNVMVPGKHIRKIEVEERPSDEPSAPMLKTELKTPKEPETKIDVNVTEQSRIESSEGNNQETSDPTKPPSAGDEPSAEGATALPLQS